MAKKNSELYDTEKPTKRISGSEHIRRLFKINPDMKPTEVVSTLAEAGIQVKVGLVYFVKGEIKGRKKQKAKASKMIAEVASATETTGAAANGDAVFLILQVKGFASQIGGMQKLKALVDALS